MEMPHNMLLVLKSLKGKLVEVTLRGGDDIGGVLDEVNDAVLRITKPAFEPAPTSSGDYARRRNPDGSMTEYVPPAAEPAVPALAFYVRVEEVAAVREISPASY